MIYIIALARPILARNRETMMEAENERRRPGPEPILKLPPAITGFILTLVAIHAVVTYGPDWMAAELYDRFAFIPARFAFQFAPVAALAHIASQTRFDESRLALALDGGVLVYVTPLSYAFLHGNWTHVFVNALSLTAFGTPAARRLRGWMFTVFFALCAIAGAMTHFALHAFDLTPVVGASAAISGTIGAIARFAFTPGSRLSSRGVSDSPGAQPGSMPLSAIGANRQASLFIASWLVLNFLLGAFPQAIGVAGVIAWEAHLGGFVFGLLTFGIFDRAARRAP